MQWLMDIFLYFPQPGGGVQISDRWNVDTANDVYPGIKKMDLGDKTDRVADLGKEARFLLCFIMQQSN
jgi:hypothetical protein